VRVPTRKGQCHDVAFTSDRHQRCGDGVRAEVATFPQAGVAGNDRRQDLRPQGTADQRLSAPHRRATTRRRGRVHVAARWHPPERELLAGKAHHIVASADILSNWVPRLDRFGLRIQ